MKTFKWQDVLDFIKDQPDEKPVDFSHCINDDDCGCLMVQFGVANDVEFISVNYSGNHLLKHCFPYTVAAEIKGMPFRDIIAGVMVDQISPQTFGELKKNLNIKDMKTKLEIIEETVKFYTSKNRGMGSDGTCRYITSDGKKCAVGRCMTEEAIAEDGYYEAEAEPYAYYLNIVYKNDLGLDNVLADEYKGHSVYFWDCLQKFHDNDFNWNDEGLTERGEEMYQQLIERFKN